MDWLSSFLNTHGVGLGLFAVFVGGLALNLTPCVYPMIPVTLAFFAGQADGSIRRIAQLAVWYVVGLSLSYAALGLVAAKTGALLGSWLQQPAVLVGISLVIVALSLSMFGWYELRLPRALTQRLGRALAGAQGAFAMGLVVGIVAAPCVGPFVLGLMLFVGELADPAAGFLLFFSLGLGMGLPMILLAVMANRAGHLPRAGAWLVWSKKALGVALWGVALYLVRPLLPSAVFWLAMTGLLVGAGAYLGWLERTVSSGRWFRGLRTVVGSSLIVAAILAAWPKPPPASAIPWVPYTEAAFAEAQRAGRPSLIDITADWCLPCVELDHVTFRHPDVVQALGALTAFRLDVTRETTAEQDALLSRSRVLGVPTVLFFDAGGRERDDLRLTGFEAPDEFLRRLARLHLSSGTP